MKKLIFILLLFACNKEDLFLKVDNVKYWKGIDNWKISVDVETNFKPKVMIYYYIDYVYNNDTLQTIKNPTYKINKDTTIIENFGTLKVDVIKVKCNYAIL